MWIVYISETIFVKKKKSLSYALAVELWGGVGCTLYSESGQHLVCNSFNWMNSSNKLLVRIVIWWPFNFIRGCCFSITFVVSYLLCVLQNFFSLDVETLPNKILIPIFHWLIVQSEEHKIDLCSIKISFNIHPQVDHTLVVFFSSFQSETNRKKMAGISMKTIISCGFIAICWWQ